MDERYFPSISVITVVYNGEHLLERTIKSILGQTYKNIEYIVIDGQSKDNSVEIIKKYTAGISYFVSEPDKGLYDAMNKGIDAATGDYLLFINAGDELYESTTLEKVVNSFGGYPDIYYGETLMVDEQFQPLGYRSEMTPHRLPAHLKWENMSLGMVVCHQSILIRRTIAEKYDLRFPFCADIDWIINALKKSEYIVNTGLVISRYLKGGISDKKMKKSLMDRFAVMRKHFGLYPTIVNHIVIVIRALWFYNRKKTK
jgi:glycosyltransferase involved in cell wall biosynthesis